MPLPTSNINYNNAAACNNVDGYVDDDDRGTLYFNLDITLSLMSSLSLGFIALIILTDKRIQGHPNKLIAFTCLIDAFNFYNYFSRYLACGYGLNLQYSLLFASTVQDPIFYVKCNWLHQCNWQDILNIKQGG